MEALRGWDVELEALVVIGSQAHVVVTIGYVGGGHDARDAGSL